MNYITQYVCATKTPLLYQTELKAHSCVFVLDRERLCTNCFQTY